MKKDLLGRLFEYFAPMRERRSDLEKRLDDVEDVLLAVLFRVELGSGRDVGLDLIGPDARASNIERKAPEL